MIDLTKFEGHTPGPLEHDPVDWLGTVARDGHVTVTRVSHHKGLGGLSVIAYANDADRELHRAAPELLAEVERLWEVLDELVDVVEGAVAGEYALDSHTTQPARRVLAAEPEGK